MITRQIIDMCFPIVVILWLALGCGVEIGYSRIHPGGSIGEHTQDFGDDMNYIFFGSGKAFYDDVEEKLMTGVMHICPQGHKHSIINTGDEDLVMLTLVVKR